MKRHCNIRQISRSQLARVTLLAALACIRVFADNTSDLLRQICEEQKKRAGILENVSYTVVCEGQHYFENVHLPIKTSQKITLLNGNARMSRSHYISGRSPLFVMNEYCKEELLLNDEMLLVWTGRKEQNLSLYYRSDFDAASMERILDRYIPYDPIALRYTTDGSETLVESVESYFANSDDSRWTWKIDTDYNNEKQPSQFVLHRSRVEESRPDIVIKVDPTRDYVVTSCVIQPYRQPDNYRRTTTKDFERINGQWMVSRYELTEISDDFAQPLMDITVSISNVMPTPPEAAKEMTLSALKLPGRMSVDVAAPGEREVTNMRGGRLDYLNGEFVPSRGPVSSAPLALPLPNAPKSKTDVLIDWAIENLIYLIP